MRAVLDRQLAALRTQVLDLGTLATQQLESLLLAVERRDGALALEVARADSTLDAAESAIDAAVVRILALHQPEAIDLRALLAALRIATALERIGDHAKTVAKRLPALIDRPSDPDLLTIGRLAQSELVDAMRAYADGDADLALALCARDVVLDRLYAGYCETTLAAMEAQPAAVRPGAFLLYAARNFERIGDQATNIAERVHFAVRGRLPQEERPR
ncbi:MAG: phosphate transport system protein [Rhodospirillales bacterium]|nr:phosphate transport system protein [Rhodospirillales bacterium]